MAVSGHGGSFGDADGASLTDLQWRTVLERIIAAGGPDVVAQPIADVASGRVGGFELLARFPGPHVAAPDVWFAAARRTGLDAALTAVTVRRMRALALHRPADTFFSLNVEPHLLLDDGVREALTAVPAGAGPSPAGPAGLAGLVVELTEHVDAAETVGILEVLADLRARGARIAMDDAGTGYSGLTQMLAIRPDVVKLDRELVTGLASDPVRRAAVRLLGELAGQMDAWLLAEGVETHAEAIELVCLGVPLLQGWALGRPGQGWPLLAAGITDVLARQVSRSELDGHVLALVRPATTHVLPEPGEARAAAEARLAVGDVVLGTDGRPEHVVVADPAGGMHRVPAMVVAPSAPPPEVLHRAMSRMAAWQHAPVVCTDPRGVVIGTVDVTALVEHVVRGR